MIKFTSRWKEFWWNVFSENGIPSSKRIFGGFMILCAQICLLVSFILDGPTEVVKDLIMCDIFTGASLLGLNNITSIWKGGKIGIGENAPKLDEEKQNEDDENEPLI